MAEDRISNPSGQEPPPPPANQASVEFLNRYVPRSKERLFLAGSFPGKARIRVVGYYSDARMLALPDNERHHVTAAMYPEGPSGRKDAMATAVWAIVFDDVGRSIVAEEGATPISKGVEVDEDVFLFLPEPSWRIETSRGCYQYGYHISPSMLPRTARRVLAALKKDPVLGKGLHSLGQYLRLPTGTNTKPGGEGFRTRLASTGPSWSLEDFVDGFALDLDAVTEAEAAEAGVSRGEQLPPVAVGKLLALIPNDEATYDVWIRVGHAVWGATGGSEEGRELWVEWSSRAAKFDLKQDTAKTWDSFSAVKASASTLRVIIEEIYGPQSKERMEAESIFALEMFDEIDEASLEDIDKAAEERAKLDFKGLLKEARSLAKIPQKFRAESDDANWTADEKFASAFELAGTVQPASPTVFAPFDRGVVSVRAGAPYVGKSLLLLNQVCAFCFNRPDLLGAGFGADAIQFQGDVLYFSNEDSRSVVIRRVAAWMKRWELTGADAPHQVLPVRSLLLSRTGKGAVVECLRVLRIAVEHLRAGHELSMIVIDTMASSVSGVEENSTKETGEVLMMLREIAWAFWSSVVFIHHGTKVAWKIKGGDDADLGSSLRGSGNFGGTVRGADNVREVKEDEKERYGWAGRKVVGLQVLKASDTGDFVGERFYEIETVSIEVEHAEQDGVLVQKRMPVMVPLEVVAGAGFVDEERLAVLVRQLAEAIAVKPVWRFVRLPRKPVEEGVAVHDLWGMEMKKASDMVDMLVARNRFRVADVRLKGNVHRDQILPVEEAF